MSVAVTAITFDHGRGQAGSYTVPLRFNETEAVLLPEWQRGNRFPSVAAYIRDRLPSIALILVRFAVTSGESRHLEIQARVRSDTSSFSPASQLLPDLPPLRIWFSTLGDSGWCAFPLDTIGFLAGVNAATQQWIWQFRRVDNEPWMDFDATFHRIYVVLSPPTAPWFIWPAHPVNTSLPRTDALDFACHWARGARDEIEAAARITESVYNLGGEFFEYDAVVGAPHYTVLGVPRFLCDAFLDRLRGGEGVGPLVNCSDCATIVSTFANLLGADLWQSKMGLVGTGFRLNPIFAIGGKQWSTLWGGFAFHEVAWSGECTELDTVYDACLKTDKDQDPTEAPQEPSLPVNQIFGTPGSAQYRDQIASPPDRDKCAPQPAFRMRRLISSQSIMFTPSISSGLHLTLAERAQSDRATASPREGDFFVGFFLFGGELPGWSMASAASFDGAEQPPVVLADVPIESQKIGVFRVLVSTWRSAEKPTAKLRVESIETTSSRHARQTLIRVASEIESPMLEFWDRNAPGETTLKSTNDALVFFTRGNLVHIVRSAGREIIDVRKEVEVLDNWLTSSGSQPSEQSWKIHSQIRLGSPAIPHWRRFHFASAGPNSSLNGIPLVRGAQHRALIHEYVITALHSSAWNSLNS